MGGWAVDRIGPINDSFYACFFALTGGALQAATQTLDFILVARVATGMGTDALAGITPVSISEVFASEYRGGFLGYVFIANYLGILVACWLSFGLAFMNDGYSDVKWRFVLAFQCFPTLLLLLGIKTHPDSLRFYAAVRKFDKGKEVLT